ncbi:MAG: hypothetical protein JF628_02590 [Sphingomonas sp.]|nr:hypothetical protein [Sphingomonas sp.]
MADRLVMPIRFVIEDPVPGVRIALQRGATARAALIPPVSDTPDALTFDFDAAVEGALADGRPRLLGPFVQGPPEARFVYLCVGQAAGQIGSEWNRRMKVPLGGISEELAGALQDGGRLEARIASRGRDGSPACASVPLLAPGWRVHR